eukprot:c24989_g2_i2 orf=106-573(+)
MAAGTIYHQLRSSALATSSTDEHKPNKKSRPSSSHDLLWKEFFRDPSQWWDNRRSKAGSAYPDFKHKVTKDSLWIHGCYNSSWVDEELRRRGLSVSSQAQDGDPCHDNGTAFVALLRACAKNRDLYRGTKLHNDVLRRGLLEKCSGNLVTMYAKC